MIIWFYWGFNAVLIVLFCLLLSLFLPKKAFNPIMNILSRIFLFNAFIFPKISGYDPKKLPFPVIFTPNHVSFFDLFISGAVLPGYPRGLQLKKFFSIPIYGWLISRFGMIPIETGKITSIKKSFNKVIDILNNKERNFLIMPEGERTVTGKVGNFKSGAFLISKKTGVPVVPVVYKGLFEINNKVTKIIKPGSFDVIFLKPVYPDKFDNEDVMAGYVRNQIIKKLEE